jgi:predicted dehydrogenase
MAPLRFGLLGTGYWALHTHGTALSASRHAVLHGVWGRDPAKADDLARRFGARGYADLDELLDEVDAVAIAVPPDVQAQLAVKAAQAGCHLLLEKPLALDLGSAEAVVRAADEAGVASVMFFTSRFRPEAERWTQTAAEVGGWQSAHLVHYANIFQPGSPYAGSAWRKEYGALWDIGPHALAAVLPIMGKVTSVAARSGPAGSDTVHIVLTHGSQPVAAPPEPALAALARTGPGETDPTRAGATRAVVEEVPAQSPMAADGSRLRSQVPVGAVSASTVSASTVSASTVSASTLSISLTMPPAATVTHFSLYGEHGSRARPEGNFDVADVFGNAIAELSALVEHGERRHRCDVHFGLEVARVLEATERALELRAVELRY